MIKSDRNLFDKGFVKSLVKLVSPNFFVYEKGLKRRCWEYGNLDIIGFDQERPLTSDDINANTVVFYLLVVIEAKIGNHFIVLGNSIFNQH